MAKDIRFECKYCASPIFASPDLGGKRMKCPQCKEPVTIPVTAIGEGDEGNVNPEKVSHKNQKLRPIQQRHKAQKIKSLIKLIIVLAIAYAAYVTFFQGKKPADIIKDIKENVKEKK